MIAGCQSEDENGANFDFTPYFVGSMVTESPNNVGNVVASAQTTSYPGTDTACQAAAACAYYTYTQPAIYLSFDLHFDSSQIGQEWQCTAYYNQNHDGSAFNVANPTVTCAFGYSVPGCNGNPTCS